MIADPKPSSRHIANRDEWTQIVMEKHGPCRACGNTGPVEMHHLVNRSQRGDDLPANLVPLCPNCHLAYTARTAAWADVAHAIRHSLTPLEAGYVRAKKGRAWVERMYPSAGDVLCARCRRPVKASSEATGEPQEPRRRKRWQIAVPDDAEDGADVLDTLVDAHRDRLKAELGWDDGVQPYFVIVSVLSEGLR